MYNIELSGIIIDDYVLDHEYKGEKFYKTYIEVQRSSGYFDVIPILLSDRMFDLNDSIVGKYVFVIGSIRTYNLKSNGKTKLMINVFVENIEILDIDEKQIDNNSVFITGFICKNLGIRTTPSGRSICDFILAVNREYGKSDYIPCIAWGKNAIYTSKLSVGDCVNIEGRLQSRKYDKNGSDMIAYEISVQNINKD